MKKYIICLIVSLFLVGCGDSAESTPVDDLIEVKNAEGSPEVGTYIEIPEELQKEPKDFSALDDIKVDENITLLPASLAFAQVQRMMYYPEEYNGSTVKMTGLYYYEQIPALDIGIRAIMMMDEGNCCQGYFELEFLEEVEYPKIGEEIMVTGRYEMRNDGSYNYGVLIVSEYIF